MSAKSFDQITANELAGLSIDLHQKLRKGSMSFEQIKWFVNLPFPKREKLMKGSKNPATAKPFLTIVEFIKQWELFYQKHFSLELSFAGVVIPERPTDGHWNLILIAQGLTLNQVYKSMSAAFKCWKYADDLDTSVTKNIRGTQNTYALWVRDGVEPDEKYLGKSTNEVDPDMAIGVTLLERMIMEIMYFDLSGKHLDIKGLTFCSGSRDSYGDVPYVYFSDGRVRVLWCDLGNSDAECGVREAVSK